MASEKVRNLKSLYDRAVTHIRGDDDQLSQSIEITEGVSLRVLFVRK